MFSIYLAFIFLVHFLSFHLLKNIYSISIFTCLPYILISIFNGTNHYFYFVVMFFLNEAALAWVQ